MAAPLYESQKRAIRQLKTGSVLWGGVGTGKSRTALGYYVFRVCGGYVSDEFRQSDLKSPRPLYIITIAKKRDEGDWLDEAANFRLLAPNMPDIFVDSWNNIEKYVGVHDAFFIFDEQRIVGKGAWAKSFLKIAAKNDWIVLSATPGDTWMDYVTLFIANGFFKNRTEFNRKHVVFNRFTKYPKVERYVDVGYLERCRDSILVPLDQEKRSTRHHEWVKVAYDHELYEKVSKDRWNIYEEQPVLNASEYCQLLRKIVNADEHRLMAVADILKRHRRAIVFYSFNYELELLENLMHEIGMPYSQWNGHKHEAILDGREWVYLVNYSAGAEGWNCITTDTVIFYSQHYSWKVMEQACGRIDRVNTPYTDLYYFHIFSDSGIDYAIRRCIKKKAIFNERSFAPL